MFIQTSVKVSHIDLDIGVGFPQSLKSFGSSDDAHKLDVLSSVLFDEGKR